MPELARYITYGASPRASINLILTARALALLRGREYVLPRGRARHGARRACATGSCCRTRRSSDNVTADRILLPRSSSRVPVPDVPLQ